MNKFKKIAAVLVSTIMACSTMPFILSACGGGNRDGDTQQAVGDVSKIQVTTMPTQSEYYVGETFSAAGGKITVTMVDGSTKEVDLTDSNVTLGAVNTDKAGEKTVTVKYGGKRTTFKITVKVEGFKVTFDHNYTGDTDSIVEAEKGKAVKKPTDPTRSGYTFDNWYTDAACTVPYDFSTIITANTTVYANWKENGATYFDVTYDLNYYGIAPQTYKQIVKSGETARNLAVTPSRNEYSFDGWYTDVNCSTAYTAGAISANTTIYAKWAKTKTGSSTYVFEAEQTNLKGKSGPGFSGTAQEEGMIVTNATANGEKAVSYLYQRNLTLDFYIASGEAVSDATVVISIAAELDNINFNSDEFQILINGEAASYTAVSLVNDKTFRDGITITGVSLEEGANLIQLKVNNAKRPLGDASTYAATAPMVDCIKITTSAVLSWDANYGLPMEY